MQKNIFNFQDEIGPGVGATKNAKQKYLFFRVKLGQVWEQLIEIKIIFFLYFLAKLGQMCEQLYGNYGMIKVLTDSFSRSLLVSNQVRMNLNIRLTSPCLRGLFGLGDLTDPCSRGLLVLSGASFYKILNEYNVNYTDSKLPL